jgi:N4-gp56 family major capsid protein
MADALLGKTEVDAVSQEVISTIVQDLLIQEAKLIQTVSDFSSLAEAGSDKIKIPRSGGFTVGDKSENTAVDAQIVTYATDDLDLNKHKVIQVLMEDYAKLQSKINAVQDMTIKAAKALALQIDTDIIAGLVATSASSPDHRIALAGSDLAEADILSAKELLDLQNVPQDERYFVIGADFMADLMTVANFIQAERYGSNMNLLKGEVGMAYGFRFIMHTGLTTTGVAYHKSHVAFAMQQSLRYQSMPDLANLAVRHSFDQVYGVKTLDSGKRGVLVGSAT